MKQALKVRNINQQKPILFVTPIQGDILLFNYSQGWHPGLSCFTPLELLNYPSHVS